MHATLEQNSFCRNHPDFIGDVRDLLDRQPEVPMSPGAFGPDGSPMLCLGAAAAFAGIRAHSGPEAAAHFAHRTVRSRDKQTIVDGFAAIGWRREDALELIAANDSLDAEGRKPAIVACLSRLAVAP